MSDLLLSPPLAFLVYLGLAALLSAFGRALAGPQKPSALKSSQYASGEASPQPGAAPGYRPFFTLALFFAILHLGVLILGTGGLNWMSAAYLVGLFLALIALILG
jgi:NADH:ubiquinone oxidoreductase subunit 3 (subunit A)